MYVSARRVLAQAVLTGVALGCLAATVVALVTGRGRWPGWFLPVGFAAYGAALGLAAGATLLAVRYARSRATRR
jgi:hypothetical protein